MIKKMIIEPFFRKKIVKINNIMYSLLELIKELGKLEKD
jgi:hypothetical protein